MVYVLKWNWKITEISAVRWIIYRNGQPCSGIGLKFLIFESLELIGEGLPRPCPSCLPPVYMHMSDLQEKLAEVSITISVLCTHTDQCTWTRSGVQTHHRLACPCLGGEGCGFRGMMDESGWDFLQGVLKCGGYTKPLPGQLAAANWAKTDHTQRTMSEIMGSSCFCWFPTLPRQIKTVSPR